MITVLPDCHIIAARHDAPLGDDGRTHYPTRGAAQTACGDDEYPVPAGPCAEIQCDGCGERYDEPADEPIQHVDPADTTATLRDAAWITRDDRHYCCPSCADQGGNQ